MRKFTYKTPQRKRITNAAWLAVPANAKRAQAARKESETIRRADGLCRCGRAVELFKNGKSKKMCEKCLAYTRKSRIIKTDTGKAEPVD